MVLDDEGHADGEGRADDVDVLDARDPSVRPDGEDPWVHRDDGALWDRLDDAGLWVRHLRVVSHRHGRDRTT